MFFFRRPIQLLYPLEIHELETDAEAAPPSNPEYPMSAPDSKCDAPTCEEPESRPKRAAAKQTTEKMKAWAEELQQD